jgi:hypothetical protein
LEVRFPYYVDKFAQMFYNNITHAEAKGLSVFLLFTPSFQLSASRFQLPCPRNACPVFFRGGDLLPAHVHLSPACPSTSCPAFACPRKGIQGGVFYSFLSTSVSPQCLPRVLSGWGSPWAFPLLPPLFPSFCSRAPKQPYFRLTVERTLFLLFRRGRAFFPFHLSTITFHLSAFYSLPTRLRGAFLSNSSYKNPTFSPLSRSTPVGQMCSSPAPAFWGFGEGSGVGHLFPKTNTVISPSRSTLEGHICASFPKITSKSHKYGGKAIRFDSFFYRKRIPPSLHKAAHSSIHLFILLFVNFMSACPLLYLHPLRCNVRFPLPKSAGFGEGGRLHPEGAKAGRG